MNKSEHRQQLIRALVAKNKIHTQAELQALLADNDIQVTQATLSRDIKSMNLSKVREEDNSYYVLNAGSISKWEKTSRTLHGRCSCLDASSSTPSPTKNPSWTGPILWGYHWCFEFPWRYRYPLWWRCLSCHLWRCRDSPTLLWRFEKIHSTIFLWRIRKFRVWCGTEFCYILYWDGFSFLVRANLRARFGLRRLNSSSNFFSFQRSAAETKLPSASRKDIGLSPIPVS